MPPKTAAGPDRGNKLNLAFGLVNVPVRYKPLADTAKTVSAKLTCPEHGPELKQGYTCSVGTDHEHAIERADIAKSYPHPDSGELVVVDPAVLEEFAESRTGNAQIEKIVDATTIDPAYFDKVYLVWPDAGGEDAFDLLAAVLRSEQRAAVTTTVISKQTQTVVFRWSEELECLLAHVCRFTTNIRHADVETVKAVSATRTAPPANQVEAAKALFASLAGEFDPSEVEDEWTPLVQDAIRQAAGGKVPAKAAAKPSAKASDLMGALMASVEATKEKPAPKPRAKKKVAA